jgi:hypothetical protein
MADTKMRWSVWWSVDPQRLYYCSDACFAEGLENIRRVRISMGGAPTETCVLHDELAREFKCANCMHVTWMEDAAEFRAARLRDESIERKRAVCAQ